MGKRSRCLCKDALKSVFFVLYYTNIVGSLELEPLYRLEGHGEDTSKGEGSAFTNMRNFGKRKGPWRNVVGLAI